jgi:hypothetical protein
VLLFEVVALVEQQGVSVPNVFPPVVAVTRKEPQLGQVLGGVGVDGLAKVRDDAAGFVDGRRDRRLLRHRVVVAVELARAPRVEVQGLDRLVARGVRPGSTSSISSSQT